MWNVRTRTCSERILFSWKFPSFRLIMELYNTRGSELIRQWNGFFFKSRKLERKCSNFAFFQWTPWKQTIIRRSWAQTREKVFFLLKNKQAIRISITYYVLHRQELFFLGGGLTKTIKLENAEVISFGKTSILQYRL